MAARSKRTVPDAIGLLAAEQRRIGRILRSVDADPGDRGGRRAIAERACEALKQLATLEAEIFYPAARAALGPADTAAVAEAEVEHGAISALVAELEPLEPADPYHAATFAVLARYVNAHFRAERSGLFPRLRGAALDRAQLADALDRRRRALDAAADAPGQPEPSAEAEGEYEPAFDEEVARLLSR